MAQIPLVEYNSLEKVLLYISKRIAPNFTTEAEAATVSIFRKALEAPFSTMAANAGMSPEVAKWSLEDTSLEEGYNFFTCEKTNLMNKGIIDPAKVTRCALKNAVSVAGTLLLTNHSIVHS